MALKGVYPAKKKNGDIYYRTSITYKSRHISLGSFDNEAAAHNAYKEARELLKDDILSLSDIEKNHDTQNISESAAELKNLSDSTALSFHKKVSLLNFRDNGIYISNPIYLYRKFFEYYLSPTRILKFDRDDLFYYSSHKIMERGGRLFVADYGMQIGIHTRYGIKPYAVEGRDYHFVNGDNNDFRYENIQITNIYNGVEHLVKNGKSYYKARIHVNGNIVIGTYDTDTEAAIAYNKAINRLSEMGIKRAYSPNYIQGLSKEEYLLIYSAIPLSDYFAE